LRPEDLNYLYYLGKVEPSDVEKESLCSPKHCWWLQDLNLEVSDRIAIVTGKELSE